MVQDVVNHVRQLDRRGFKSEFSPLRNVRDRPAEKKVNRFRKHSKFLQYESKKKKKKLPARAIVVKTKVAVSRFCSTP